MTIQELRADLLDNHSKKIGRSRIQQIISEELKADLDYFYINPRLIMLNGRGVNKIKKKLKII